MSKLSAIFCGIIITIFLVHPVFAAETPWAKTDHARMRLLTAVDSVNEASSFEAALHMNMSKGWHSYWRVPGDAGAPPRFDWTGSNNVESVDLSWQAPKRFEEFEFQTFGYSGDVYFPLVVHLKEPGKAVFLDVKIQTMICKDICIPQIFELSLSLPEGEGTPSKQKRIIDFEKKRVPLEKDIPTLKINTVVTGPEALVVSAYSANGFRKIDIFAYGPDMALTGIPEITTDERDPRYAMIKVPKPFDIDNLGEVLSGKEMNITLVNGREAIERTFTP